jgi:gamma-glutamyltranspeptidase/glutathione hydrolase
MNHYPCISLIGLWIAANTMYAFADEVAPSRKANMPKAVVASYNAEARMAGKQILEEGGNAFDAFVAATLVEYIVAPGVTSLAGPLNALVYHKNSGEQIFLDAEMNHVADPDGIWAEGEPDGKGVMVPGALRGLESIHQRFGKLPWSRLLQPAIELAKNGFLIDESYAGTISYRAEVLKSTPYGERTFFRQGKPLQTGERLVQSELALFLEKLADQGASVMYVGEWGKRFVATVQERGGRMREDDLRNYLSQWLAPRHITYRGYDVYGSSGRSYGGAWSLLALKTLEYYHLSGPPHVSESADRLEVVVRIAKHLWSESWLFETEILDSDQRVAQFLTSTYGSQVWERVRQELPALPPKRRGNHSYHIVVVDRDGNAITGTNTINSLPWGDGIFVDGIPLTNELSHIGNATRPGERRLSPMSSHLVFENGRLKVVSGTFNSSLVEAGFQLVVNAIDFNLNAKQASTLPRFGTYSFDDDNVIAGPGKMWLDPAVAKQITDELRHRGLEFEQDSPFIDTGSGAIAILAEDGSVDAALLPLVGHEKDEPIYID